MFRIRWDRVELKLAGRDEVARDGPSESGADTDSAADTVSGRHLWKIGNCEAGTLTEFDADTNQATLCGDARVPEECTGSRLFTVEVEGNLATFRSMDGANTERYAFERTLDCEQETGRSQEVCPSLNEALSTHDDLYVLRAEDLPPDEQLHSDSLWLILSAGVSPSPKASCTR